ncbi:MAG TPA: MliC family protein [Gemmatimonadaceae bacterium]|nr:MliC family protein [Gemmatimonadaceae bacterium]
MPGRRVLAIGAAGLALAACATVPPPPPGPTYTFRCADGYTVSVRFFSDGLRLRTPDTSVVMAHTISADGGRYRAGDLVFWEKGATAFIQRGDTIIHRDCERGKHGAQRAAGP